MADVLRWQSLADHDVVGDALTCGRVPAALSFLTTRWQRVALDRDAHTHTQTQTQTRSTAQRRHKQLQQDLYPQTKPSQRRWFIAAVEAEDLVHGCAQRFRALGQFLVYELLCKDKSDAVHLCEALLQTMGVHATSFFRFVCAL